MNGKYTPPEKPKTEYGIVIGKGVMASAAKIGNVCQLTINGILNEGVTEWEFFGQLPAKYTPAVEVIVLNCAYMDHYLVLKTTGAVQIGKTMPSGWYVQTTATYITNS